MNAELFASLPGPLLAWYDLHARVLPWRENPTPYRVWISEIMLQQTRVEAVKPYFERFLARFPSVDALAEAPEEVLLKLWEGLGYYSRARNLRKAALAIRERFGGVFPERYEEIRALPGIGDYTAGAIASISFGQPCPAVDGNVLRVIARVTGTRADLSKPALRREIGNRLKAVYPSGRCGDFTQSLMELGATVCLPNGAPKCGECPLAGFCVGLRTGCARDLPLRPEKKARRVVNLTVFLLRCGDCAALRRRPEKGVLAGLWEFPNMEGKLSESAVREHLKASGIRVLRLSRSICARHVFTHLEWEMGAWRIDCAEPHSAFRWVTRDALRGEIALPSAWKAFSRAVFSDPPSA